MTRDEIRDIIARTLCPKPWGKTGPEAHAAYKKVADVILEALEAAGLCIAPKEPTEAMVNIGEDMLDVGAEAEAVYRAMIAASKEG